MSEENELSGHAEEAVVKKNQIVQEKGLGYVLNVDKQDLFKAAEGLKEAGFDLFLFVSGIDYPDSIKLTYRVYSTKKRNEFGVIIKTEVPKSNPVIDSLVPLWSAAGWHERETFDLYGVQFTGHPDLRRIFMPEDWVGYPLRKDYSDGHMIVMDDGKKDKAEAGEKERPVAKPAKAESTKDKEANEPRPETGKDQGGVPADAAEEPVVTEETAPKADDSDLSKDE